MSIKSTVLSKLKVQQKEVLKEGEEKGKKIQTIGC